MLLSKRALQQVETKDFAFETKRITEAGEIEGMASVFGVLDHGGDRVEKGAFTDTLRRHEATDIPVAFLRQHDPDRHIGEWTELIETDEGLYCKGQFFMDMAAGVEAHALASKRAMRGLSIGYRTIRAENDRDGNRVLLELDLWEISLVTFPMNPAARVVDVKSEMGKITTAERALRDAGYSRKEAKAIVAVGFNEAMRQAPEDSLRDADSAKLLQAFEALCGSTKSLEEATRYERSHS